MPVFLLTDDIIFPHPVLRDDDGLLAFGGDLSPERLLLAYRWGIFPWYAEGQPLMWWWLCPRLLVRPDEVHISHSLKSRLRKSEYEVTFNSRFDEVVSRCASVKRKDQDGTWITREMREAYVRMHQMGHAQSVEVWHDGVLVGGLYGVRINNIFCGESMFAKMPDASKVGFVHLARVLSASGCKWIDCQQDTPHMRSLGGKLYDEDEYLEILRLNQLVKC